jgi:hypothetical protein
VEVLLGFSTASRLWGLTTRERKIGLSLKLKIAARLGLADLRNSTTQESKNCSLSIGVGWIYVVRRGLEENSSMGMNVRLGITKVEAYHSMCRTGVESANAGAARKALRLSPCSRPFRDLRPRTSRYGRRTVCVGESWRCFEVLFDGNICIEFCFLTAMQPVQYQDSSYSEACQVLGGFGQRSAPCELSALAHVNDDHDMMVGEEEMRFT